jgi:Outer membrane protein beta-barrel domain
VKQKLSILFLLVSFVALGQHQRGGTPNLSEYYKHPLHFGFAISYNKADFFIDKVAHFERFDSLKTIEVKAQPGFNLGIVSEYAFQEYFTLRFIPNISFAERHLSYFVQGYKDIVYIKKIESTYINFPVDLKLRSKRVQNFGAYLLAGGAFNLDLASKKNQREEATPVLSKQTVKLKRNDLSYEMGVGTEFYLMYFKFAIEGKLSIGTNNMLIQEGTFFTNPIQKLNSKMFILSITFEG